jgi:DNA-binding transcriptional LysR family regulator
MEIFLKLADTGQFTRAAKQLSVSKSTVSQAISDLEAYLGLQLVKRDGRSLQLTDAGQIYSVECRRVLADINHLEDQVRSESLGMSGQISLTAPNAYMTKTLTPLLLKFIKIHPNISLDLSPSEYNIDLVAEGVDVAFRVGNMKDSGLLARKIGATKMQMCAAPSYLDKYGQPRDISDLKNHNCLVYSNSPDWVFEQDGEHMRFQPKGSVRTSSGDNLREFVLGGLGIGFFPGFLISDDLESGVLMPVLEDIPGLVLDINLVRPADRHCPKRITEFMNFIQSELQIESRAS